MRYFFAFLVFLLFFSPIFSAENGQNYLSNEEIINHFKTQIVPENISVIIKNRENVPNYKDFEFAQIEISENNKNTQLIEILIKDGFIFPEAVDVKKNVSLKEKVEDKLFRAHLINLFKNETKKNIISLGNPEKPTLIVFSDPECPFCQKALENIEKTLSKNSVKMILTPVHELSSLEKSALIYEEIGKAKNDKQKISILRKYFNLNNTMPLHVAEEKVAKIDALRQKYFKAGLNSVPVIIAEQDIAKK